MPSSNKTTATEVSVDAFIAGIAKEEQRADAEVLRSMMERVTGEPATMWGPSMVGFGSYHYRYESGREGDMFVVGFAPRSGKTALYLYLPDGLGAHADALARLGKHEVSKACVYVRRLRDIDTTALEDLVRTSWAMER